MNNDKAFILTWISLFVIGIVLFVILHQLSVKVDMISQIQSLMKDDISFLYNQNGMIINDMRINQLEFTKFQQRIFTIRDELRQSGDRIFYDRDNNSDMLIVQSKLKEQIQNYVEQENSTKRVFMYTGPIIGVMKNGTHKVIN